VSSRSSSDLEKSYYKAQDADFRRQNDTAQPVSTKRVKELFSIIEATFTSIIDPLERMVENNWDIYRTYYPDIVLAYLSVLLSGSFFIHRDSATKAMDLATVVADKERGWLQKAFLETGRMSELVEAFAIVSRAMLKLGEHDLSKSKPAKKRGNRGETLRIWDVNVRN
jgi:nuclear pore complex protein Nup107